MRRKKKKHQLIRFRGNIATRHGFFLTGAFVTTKIRAIVTKSLLFRYDSPVMTALLRQKYQKNIVTSCNVLDLDSINFRVYSILKKMLLYTFYCSSNMLVKVKHF